MRCGRTCLQVEAHHAADAGNVRHEIELHRAATRSIRPACSSSRPSPTRTSATGFCGSTTTSRSAVTFGLAFSSAFGGPVMRPRATPSRSATRSMIPPETVPAFHAGIVRVERERPGGSLQVRRAHAGDRLAGGFDGRIVRRNLEQPRVHAVAFEQLPERRALAQQLGAAAISAECASDPSAA